MAVITKTIGSGGDYANPAAAASDFNAGTISGATSGDDIVFNVIENTAFDSTFLITANPGSYASYRLTVDPTVRHNGTAGSGARIAISSVVVSACSDSIGALNGTIEWLEITTVGSGRWAAGWNLTSAAFSASHTKTMRHCLVHRSNAHSVSPFRTVGIGVPGTSTAAVTCNLDVHNNVFWNLKSGSTVYCHAIPGTASGATARIYNNTVHDIDVTGGTAGTVYGIRTSNETNKFVSNNVVTRIGDNTTTGTKACFFGNGANTVGTNNAASDTSAFGTIQYDSLSYADIFVDADAGDFTPSTSAELFEGGTDLGTTPTNVNLDLTGRDRDALGDTWSVGAFQEGDVPPDSITINTPAATNIFQRNGSNQATVTVSGVFSMAGSEAIEYRVNGGSWATFDGSPSGGTFSESLTLSGGENVVELRFSISTGVTDSITINVGDIFFVAGQSNASGRLTNTQSYSHATLPALVYDQDDTGWRDLTDPTDPETSNGSIWPLLATLFLADQSVPVGFITTADGGTSLTGDWKPTPTTGAKYNAAVSRVNAVAPNAIKALIWDQGESDADSGVSKIDYKAALIALAANIQTATSRTFPMICDLVGNGVTGLDPIRQAQIEAADEQADIFLGANSITRRTLHWETDAEGAAHAALLWVSLDEALYGGPSARGPRLVSAVTISGTSTLTLTFDRDLLTSDSTYTASAFSVSHSGTARTISSVTRTGNRTVQVSLSGPLDGTSPTVTFASGNSAASATVPRTTAISLPATINGISSISVPAEPIYATSVTVNAPDTTAPVIAAASVNSVGDTLTVSFTEVDSPPLLPSSAATGITLSSTGASVTVSNGTRQSDLVYTFPLSRTIYSNETLLVSYSQSAGNITDSAVPTANEVPDTSNFAVTNNSTQTPTISSVSTDAIVLVGTAATITWSSAGIIGNVDILLSLDNGSTFPITIVSGTANDGSYAWTPEAAQLTAEGVIRVRSSADNAIQSTRAVKVATTEATGAGTNTDLWFRLQELAVADGLELSRP